MFVHLSSSEISILLGVIGIRKLLLFFVNGMCFNFGEFYRMLSVNYAAA